MADSRDPELSGAAARAHQMREALALMRTDPEAGRRAVLAVGNDGDAPPEPDLAGELAKLAALHEAGDLSEDEFVAAKKRLIGS